RYSVFGGGKRLRPALVLWTCAANKGRASDALPAACAIELIHTYSLIHDDLPAMDDDDFRRGRPSCHKAYDEATAILAGDALQAAAFEMIAQRTPDPSLVPALVTELARAAGSRGMVGGQQFDIDTNLDLTPERVQLIHDLKTAAMFTAATAMGAIAAHASAEEVRRMTVYGRSLGLAFQIADDMLDVCGTAEELGKTPGKDAKQRKATYPALFGLEESRRRAQRLADTAVGALSALGRRGDRLRAVAEFVVSRTH
ncbi:MAG: polyprenyl synthetase family protein, partial [Planctomycetes bacterium]|nr:polyprenyl synthetase family protein [Planctomycetota bacterium]